MLNFLALSGNTAARPEISAETLAQKWEDVNAGGCLTPKPADAGNYLALRIAWFNAIIIVHLR